MIRFNCLHCGNPVKVGDAAAGKQGKCPECGGQIVVPTATALSEDAILDILGPGENVAQHVSHLPPLKVEDPWQPENAPPLGELWLETGSVNEPEAEQSATPNPKAPVNAMSAFLGIAIIVTCCGGLCLMPFYWIPKSTDTLGPKPYTIVMTEDQPAQFLIQVVVPSGTTKVQVEEWHRQILRDFSHKPRLIVNYYDGSFDVSRLVANGTESGEAGWIGLD